MKKFKFITLSVALLMVLASFSSWAGLRDRSSLIELLPNRDRTTVVGNLINLPEVSAPTGNPTTNWGWLYVKANGSTTGLYFEDDAGTVGTVALSSLATNLPDAANYVGLTSNGILFEGATANAFETTFTLEDPTADNTITMPDDTGALLTSTLTTNGQEVANSIWAGTNQLIFEGATADAFETIITPTDPTVDRTITIPDASGEVTLLGQTPAVTSLVLAEGNLIVGDAAGAGSALDIGATNAGIAIGNGTTATIAALSGDVTMTNAGVATVAALDLETATVTNIADTELLIGTGAGTAAFATMTGDITMTNAGVTTIGSAKVTEAMQVAPSVDGLHSARIARATYDFAADGGAISTIGLGVTLPDNAIITRAWYEVLTTCTSATDAATIAISIPTDDAGGIVAALAISDVSNIWDAGIHEAIQDGTAANFSEKTTAARELSVDIAVEALTAGKFILYAEYVVSD